MNEDGLALAAYVLVLTLVGDRPNKEAQDITDRALLILEQFQATWSDSAQIAAARTVLELLWREFRSRGGAGPDGPAGASA